MSKEKEVQEVNSLDAFMNDMPEKVTVSEGIKLCGDIVKHWAPDTRSLNEAVQNPSGARAFMATLTAVAYEGTTAYDSHYERVANVRTGAGRVTRFINTAPLGEYVERSGKSLDQAVMNLGETEVVAKTRGLGVAISEEEAMYDDIGYTMDVAAMLGSAGQFTKDKLVDAELGKSSNYASGYTKSGTAEITLDELKAAHAKLRDAKVNGKAIGVRPSVLLVGFGQELPANQLIGSNRLNLTGNTNTESGDFNPVYNRYEVIYSENLSEKQWVLLDPRYTVGLNLARDVLVRSTGEGTAESVMHLMRLYGGSIMAGAKIIGTGSASTTKAAYFYTGQ